MPDSRPQWRRTRRLRADARHRRSPPRDEFCRACPRHRRHPRSCSSSWNRRLLARTDEMARTELDEADKTVMGASRTGSYEVTDVPPGDVQWTGPPRADRRIDCKTAKRRSGGESDQPRVTPSTYILTVRRWWMRPSVGGCAHVARRGVGP